MKQARTQLTDEDKGKILGLSEYFSSEKIAVKMGRSLTTIRRFLAKYEETGKSKIFQGLEDYRFLVMLKKKHSCKKRLRHDVKSYAKFWTTWNLNVV